jgi:LacI family transcriptional regulator, repressor for deo operon, udp, cdd, tsx, nupC, and nupG
VAQQRHPARIADVAALAGVSTATVSRALTAPGKLRPETLARVEAAVRRTGYTPNLPARVLRVRRSMIVLVVVPDIANPFFSDVLRGIDETLSGGGYGLLIGNLGQDRAREAQIVRIVQAGQVDGVLLLNGSVPADHAHSLVETGIAMVAVCEAIPGSGIPQVEVENRAAAREAVGHLVGLGHRSLGYIAGPPANILERERRAGFCEGLEEAGLTRRDACFWSGNFGFVAGEQAAAGYLACTRRPTAVFAANDEMAIGFIKGVRAAGLSVPRDVSVVGFDGIAFADYVEPELTTFRQPRRALGRRGAELLMRLLAGEAIAPEQMHIRLPVPLLARASSAPPP